MYWLQIGFLAKLGFLRPQEIEKLAAPQSKWSWVCTLWFTHILLWHRLEYHKHNGLCSSPTLSNCKDVTYKLLYLKFFGFPQICPVNMWINNTFDFGSDWSAKPSQIKVSLHLSFHLENHNFGLNTKTLETWTRYSMVFIELFCLRNKTALSMSRTTSCIVIHKIL